MRLVIFMRADNSAVAINPAQVMQIYPVPVNSASSGALLKGTRIEYGSSHQDVKEEFNEVFAMINSVLAPLYEPPV